jgi:replicative DNA helicase
MVAEGRISSVHLKRGSLTEEEWPRYSDALGVLSAMPIGIVDRPGTVLDLASTCRRVALERPLGLVIVDYVQLMVQNPMTEVQELTAISRTLKRLAQDLDVPVVALSQLNRNVESRIDKRPGLPDLKGSGSLEQDADVVMTIYRDEEYDPDTDEPGIAEIAVKKNRHRQKGMVKVAWSGEYQTFG